VLLREFAVKNFRPFEATSVRVPDSGLVLVAGAINAGKSALLSALDVVAGIGSDTTAWRRADRQSLPEFRRHSI
jgi:AAA15 family ATPase/GTPase